MELYAVKNATYHRTVAVYKTKRSATRHLKALGGEPNYYIVIVSV